ncbi:hypothetical protein FA13DRAFT_1737696 [Coprinellus micaceus]|uniref:Ubiquitin-like domain-containing protein n=1 Tax=Coprinellus micaceus TaxID=71717 RepID=A0A4Y7SWP7_COPMI|nr:hypothetical protein FA13DRAFT_1737696 [Coprinellus micaceus]
MVTIRFQIPQFPTERKSNLPPEVDRWVETQVEDSIELRDLKELVQSRWYDLLQSVGHGHAAPEVNEIELRWDGSNERLTDPTQSTTVEPVTKYTIFFKTQSTSGPLRVGDDDTVASLKKQVNDKMGLVNARWSVVNRTQEVELGDDNKPLKDYGVEDEDTLFFKFEGYSES